jgi:hypothetical protein
MGKTSQQSRNLFQKIGDNMRESSFLKPFFFVFETGYWGGLLTRTLAIYAAYLVLGMIPYGMIFVTNQFFATLSGDSLTGFYSAAGLFITLNLGIRTLDMVGKRLSRYLALDQQLQVQETFQKTAEANLNVHNDINKFTAEERAEKAAKLRDNSPNLSDDDIQAHIDTEEAKLVKQCGSRLTDQEKVFMMINKISEQFIQSIASVIVNVFFMINIGMARACFMLLAGMIAVNAGIIYYALNVIKGLDQNAANAKAEIRSLWQASTLQHRELNNKLVDYRAQVNEQIGKDFMVDVFNNCIRYCAQPLGIFIAVFSLAGGVFPVTNTILASGSPLTAGIIIATAAAIERIIQDTSVFAKSYQELYQSGSNFENIDILMKRGGITTKHHSATYLGSPRNPSVFDHVMHHGFFAATAWAALSVVTDLTSLALGASLPLVTLMPTLAVGIVAFIGMDNTKKAHKPDTYDYIINAVFATILTITALIVTSGNANLLATVAQIAPSLAQKVHLGCGVAALFYTLSSTCTHWLKPSQKQLEQVQKSCGAQVTASNLVPAKVPDANKPGKNLEQVTQNQNQDGARITATV